MFGSETERARWKECVEYVKENLGNPVGRMFIEENFDETSKTTVSGDNHGNIPANTHLSQLMLLLPSPPLPTPLISSSVPW